MDKKGLILCAKYAIAPNFFGYCGPDENQSLVDHLKEEIADDELIHHLSDFKTMYPYLQLIARKNKIIDPFDYRVVEAYWIGNEFLKPVSPLEYQAFAKEKLLLEKKLRREDLTNFQLQISNFKFLPHHNFHVFNIFKRTGNNPSFHILETMDECRIGFGKLKVKSQKLKVQTKRLISIKRRLFLGKPILRELNVDYNGKVLIKNLEIGDWISFHWGYVCDKLTKEQVKNLEFYTQKAIDFYNL